MMLLRTLLLLGLTCLLAQAPPDPAPPAATALPVTESAPPAADTQPALEMPGLVGSKHDFTRAPWSEGDACGPCHSPHRELPPSAAPLWDPDADLTRTFGTSLAAPGTPGRGTLMCLRCHDGTVARDTLTGRSPDRFVHKQHPGLFEAGHGRSDHPVGIPYPQFDRGYRPIVSVLASGTVRLPDGQVECVSCHDPHNQAGQPYMLVMSNARSALCLTCHRK